MPHRNALDMPCIMQTSTRADVPVLGSVSLDNCLAKGVRLLDNLAPANVFEGCHHPLLGIDLTGLVRVHVRNAGDMGLAFRPDELADATGPTLLLLLAGIDLLVGSVHTDLRQNRCE